MKHNWEYKDWKDVLNIINGKNQKSVENPHGKYPIFGSGGIMGYANDFLCPKNCTIIGRKGNINKPIYTTSKFWNVDTAFGLAPSNAIHPRFLFYFCLIYDFEKHNKATTIPSLVKKDLLNIKMPVPPMEVQEQIVAELDKINEVIDDCRELLRTLDALAQSLFYHYFGDPISNPKGWRYAKLDNIIQSKAKILRASKCFNKEDTITYIDISSINRITNRITNPSILIFSEAPSRAQQYVLTGDLLISLVRPNLKNIALCNLNDNKLVASSGFCVLRTNFKSNKYFLLYLFLTNSVTEYLCSKNSGAAYPAITEKDIREMVIPLPPLSLQEQFAERIEQIEAQKKDVEATIATMQTLLDSRMDYWFN